jgi:23S rRNA (uridine2479-2'-O)-methyltransferase
MRAPTLRVSTRNAAFQVLESLRGNRQKRRATRTFLVEGVRPITMAVEHGWELDAVVYDATRARSSWAEGILDARPEATRYEMSPDLVAALSGKDEPSELIALVRMRDRSLADVPLGPDLLVVVVDRPSSPGNLGTIVRSADALGAQAVVTTGHGADVYDPGVITASRGSLFALPVVQAESSAEVLAFVALARERLGRCRLLGADEQGAVDLADCDLGGPLVVVAGNETHGLSRAWREACDQRVRIPMTGAASSLNIAVATSIVLYEASRRRP